MPGQSEVPMRLSEADLRNAVGQVQLGLVVMSVEELYARNAGGSNALASAVKIVGSEYLLISILASSPESVGRFQRIRRFQPVSAVFPVVFLLLQSGCQKLNKVRACHLNGRLYTARELASPSAVALASALRPA